MGLFDNLESKLSSMVNGAFAKAFKSSVQPVEIASAIRTAMDDKAAVVGQGRTIVPNLYTIALSPSDYDQLSQYSDGLTDELVAAAEDHADSQRYRPAGPLRVILSEDAELETGVFKLRPASAKDPWAVSAERRPARRPAPGLDESGYADRRREDADPRDGGAPAYGPGSAAIPGGVSGGVGQGLGGAAAGAGAAATASTYRPLERADPYADGDPYAADGYDDLQATRPQQPARPAPEPRRPDPTRRPWLDIDGDRYPLLGAITVIGRDGVADIVLDDPGISRQHAEVRITNDGPHLVGSIRDLGSTNGTFVEGHRITSQRLADGDRVTVGRTSFTFRLGRG
ncbi:FhaA domain-containing protein [Arsenicicoccus bolidensis]|uniref:DUF3662 and FHA domain-containing protein n=1 Tax=Arsenicicoccus bolidensis TaxID=229480 RepID=A0ABS9Q158_9MICO|nr:DUF3662 and FHA domain-containing protein [Arsenicicoccus bolidensis]MCG7320833.1 DUF3662 and FHA domain-containing protein [Arsenicicoccus bolidensis]